MIEGGWKAAVLAWALCAGAAWSQVELRGVGQPGVSRVVGGAGEVAGVSIEGVLVKVGEGSGGQAAGGTVLIGWDRVRVSSVGDAGALFAEFAEDLWRARTRLERADWGAAEPLLERLAARVGNSGGPSAAVLHEGLLRCRLRRGAQMGAVWAWLDELRVLRTGASQTGVVWIGGKLESPQLGPVIDEKTGLAPLLPPIWVGGPALEAAAASGEWGRFVGNVEQAAGDAFLNELAMLYRAAARFEVGGAAEMPSVSTEGGAAGGGAVASGRWDGVRLVREIVTARVGDSGERSKARDALRQRLGAKELERWVEAWCRMGIGRSLLREESEDQRRQGVIELLHLPARLSGDAPYLAGLALAEATLAMDKMGDDPGAAALKAELMRVYARHPAAGVPELRDVGGGAPNGSGG